MKPAFFALGFGWMVALVGCAQGVSDPAAIDGPRDESVLSGESVSSPLDALRSRVNEDFAAAPSLRGHELVVVVTRLERDAEDRTIIAAHITKRPTDGKSEASELESGDFIGIDNAADRAISPYRSDVIAVAAMDPNGRWSIIKQNDVTRHVVEGYASALSPIEQSQWARQFIEMRGRRERDSQK